MSYVEFFVGSYVVRDQVVNCHGEEAAINA
jgi:hypothetical protein